MRKNLKSNSMPVARHVINPPHARFTSQQTGYFYGNCHQSRVCHQRYDSMSTSISVLQNRLRFMRLIPEQFEFLEAAQFGDLAQDGNEDKLSVKIQLLDGCAAVYCQAIGASAIKQIVTQGHSTD